MGLAPCKSIFLSQKQRRRNSIFSVLPMVKNSRKKLTAVEERVDAIPVGEIRATPVRMTHNEWMSLVFAKYDGQEVVNC